MIGRVGANLHDSEGRRVMSARDKFKIGDRVRESALYPRPRVRRTVSRIATVVGFGFLRNPTHLRVRRDGARYAVTYHMDFWELESAHENP